MRGQAGNLPDSVTLPDGRVVKLPDPDNLPQGGRLARWPGQDLTLCRLMFAEGMEYLFPSMCKIMHEQSGTVEYLSPTPAQLAVMDAFNRDRWVLVSKYRQAKVSTISAIYLLRDCMLIDGTNGFLVANKGDTSEEVFRKIIVLAYERMCLDPDMTGVVAPLHPKRKALATALFFAHGGSIQLLSAEAASAGVGMSADRVVFTEIGEVRDLAEVNMQFLPAVWKRPTARVWGESTPGKTGSEHERLWLNSYDGKTRFKAVFLEWWRDDTCWKDPTGFVPTDEEIAYLERHEGMNFGHLAYRREAIATIYSNSPAKFSAKHPSNYRDGWLGEDTPTFPTDPLLAMMEEALEDPVVSDVAGVGIYKKAVKGRLYAVLCDPNRFGEEGDVAAITIMDMHDNEEVAVWEGREDPTDVADRVAAASDYYNNALIVVEANAEGAVTSLVDAGYSERLFWSKRRSPGWWASTLSIQRGETRLSELLSGQDIIIHSRQTISQLIAFNPAARKRRSRRSSETTRHFDRARCLVMYADVRMTIKVPAPKVDPAVKPLLTESDRPVTILRVDDDFDKRKRRVGRGLPYGSN